MVRKFTDIELIERVESLPSFKGWKKGKYAFSVRSKADLYDQFDDKKYSFECFKDGERPKFKMVNIVTTNSGSYGLMNFDDYNHLGCAVLKADVLVYNSHIYGLHKKRPAYIQSFTVPYPYHRDNNRNKKAEEIGPIYYNRIGANHHRAGQNSTVIKNWSTACVVDAKEEDFLEWLEWMNEEPLSSVILKEW